MIFETFSKRQKRMQNAGKQDVYRYDDVPPPFRVQVIRIWESSLGNYYRNDGYETATTCFWDEIHNTLSKELGIFTLSRNASNRADGCKDFILACSTSEALDIVDMSFRVVEKVRNLDSFQRTLAKITQRPDEAIKELNDRFREHGLGYQYADGRLDRIDSQFARAEIVKPALSLLNASGFDGPADEFIRAFDHYRHGRNKEAVAEALKAFESTMKAICAARKWTHPSNATAKPLLDVLFRNGLIPAEMEAHFGGLRSAMESGLPTLSNRTSRHGQGVTPTQVPPHMAAYALHLMASNIVFLVEAHKALQ
jgi:hypothetical protein